MVAVRSADVAAYDVRVRIYPEHDRRKPVDGDPGVASASIPVLVPGEPRQLPVRLKKYKTSEPDRPWQYDWFRVEVRYRTVLGARVTQTFGWPPNDSQVPVETTGMGDRWHLRGVRIELSGLWKLPAVEYQRDE